jgi:hypothetical protein
MDPRIRIRIHTKMSWIRNTGAYPVAVGVQFGVLGPVAVLPLLPDLHQAVAPARHKSANSLSQKIEETCICVLPILRGG